MLRNDGERPDDPRTAGHETRPLARDEYDRPRYDSPRADFGTRPPQPVTRHDGRPQSMRAFQRTHASGLHHQDERPHIDRMRVHELMTRRVASVHPATTVERAARLLEECDCGALPVVGDNGVLVGMMTDRDIAIRIVARGRDARSAIVADCMTERVFACYANESLIECMRQMARHQVRRMPIVDERGRLVGIVAQGDLARHAGRHPVQEERRALTDVVCAVSEPSHMRHR
jgi:CBS domain-containing protein